MIRSSVESLAVGTLRGGRRTSDVNDASMARALIESGYAVVKAPAPLTERFACLVAQFEKIPEATKARFSFPEHTDGFLPFGMEHSAVTQQVDLCERFCYRQRFRGEHQWHPFAGTDWYDAAARSESILSALAERMLQAVVAQFGRSELIPIRDSSYLQYCAYELSYRRDDREFLQDRHEDGNLITLAMASCGGLELYPHGVPQSVSLAADELVVFSGSLLTVLSDGQIPTMDHAVRTPPRGTPRSSLVYFALPDLQRTYRSFTRGTELKLQILANKLHEGFGNLPFGDASAAIS